MVFYEYVFFVCQDVILQQVEGFVENYKGVIEVNGGKVGWVENWGFKFFIYCIKKNCKVYYVFMDIMVLVVVIQEMECQMCILEDVFCYMIVLVEVYEEGLFVMMQKCDCDDCLCCDGDCLDCGLCEGGFNCDCGDCDDCLCCLCEDCV